MTDMSAIYKSPLLLVSLKYAETYGGGGGGGEIDHFPLNNRKPLNIFTNVNEYCFLFFI